MVVALMLVLALGTADFPTEHIPTEPGLLEGDSDITDTRAEIEGQWAALSGWGSEASLG